MNKIKNKSLILFIVLIIVSIFAIKSSYAKSNGIFYYQVDNEEVSI